MPAQTPRLPSCCGNHCEGVVPLGNGSSRGSWAPSSSSALAAAAWIGVRGANAYSSLQSARDALVSAAQSTDDAERHLSADPRSRRRAAGRA